MLVRGDLLRTRAALDDLEERHENALSVLGNVGLSEPADMTTVVSLESALCCGSTRQSHMKASSFLMNRIRSIVSAA